MKSFNYIRCFEDFKQNHITIEDISKCIKGDGFIETDIVKNYAKELTEPVRPVSVDDDGEITVEIDSQLYSVDIKNVKKITFKNED